MATPENVTTLLSGFADPKKLNKEVLSTVSVSDWTTAIATYRVAIKSKAFEGFDEKALKMTYKPEVVEQMRSERQVRASQQYSEGMKAVRDSILSQKTALLTDIKAKKFPAYYGKQKTIDALGRTMVNSLPDSASRLVGATEIQTASQIPLKHINAVMLENYASAGRTDLVSALIERVAMNRGEYQGKAWDGIQKFAKAHYQQLGIEDSRLAFRRLDALDKRLLVTTTNIDCDGGVLVLIEQAVQKELEQDNLLEFV